MYYDRDVQGRIIGRYKSTITGWNYASSGDWFYNFTGAGDATDFVRNANWDIIEQNISLPGGVLLTLKPQESVANNKKQYSLPNTHGDTMLTTNAAGTNTSTGNGPANSLVYDPFGQAISGNVLPANTNGASYGWVGQHQKFTETSLALAPIPMGARIYLPGIGRFTQVDPVEGGTENNYVYPTDPISEFDLDGKFSIGGSVGRFVGKVCAEAAKKTIKSVGKFVGRNASNIGLGLAVGGLIGCTVMTGGACGAVAAGALAGTSGVVGFMGEKYKGKNTKNAALYGLMNAGFGKLSLASKPVRYFGQARNYKNLYTALKRGAGLNKSAIGRLGRHTVNFGIGQSLNSVHDKIWNKR